MRGDAISPVFWDDWGVGCNYRMRRAAEPRGGVERPKPGADVGGRVGEGGGDIYRINPGLNDTVWL